MSSRLIYAVYGCVCTVRGNVRHSVERQTLVCLILLLLLVRIDPTCAASLFRVDSLDEFDVDSAKVFLRQMIKRRLDERDRPRKRKRKRCAYRFSNQMFRDPIPYQHFVAFGDRPSHRQRENERRNSKRFHIKKKIRIDCRVKVFCEWNVFH